MPPIAVLSALQRGHAVEDAAGRIEIAFAG